MSEPQIPPPPTPPIPPSANASGRSTTALFFGVIWIFFMGGLAIVSAMAGAAGN